MESQNWDSITGGHFKYFPERVMFDSVHNELIVSSKFISKVGNLPARGICRWNGSRWDSLAGGINTDSKSLNPLNPAGNALACIPYNGKLLVGGMFRSVGDVMSTSLALWDGTKWDSLPKRAFRTGGYVPQINGFLKKGNLLYITGNFDTIAGQKATGLATWDGTNFNPITLPIGNGFQNISCVVEYKNELYISGDGFLVGINNDARDVFRYNGANWVSTTGAGVLGGFSGIAGLIVFQNELYAYGHFTKVDGNAGDNVMKWDGTNWKDVDFGNPLNFSGIYKMLVLKNKLWALGTFDEVEGKPTSKIAVYDGYSWCGLKDSLDNNILTATIYNDTIYAGGGFWSCNGDSSINRLVKLKNPDLYRNCHFDDHTIKIESYNFNLFPNPFTDNVTIQFSNDYQLNETKISITNTLGQLMLTIYPTDYNQLLSISSLASGMYYLTIQDASNKKTIKIVKQ
jgi:hypothetical protein